MWTSWPLLPTVHSIVWLVLLARWIRCKMDVTFNIFTWFSWWDLQFALPDSAVPFFWTQKTHILHIVNTHYKVLFCKMVIPSCNLQEIGQALLPSTGTKSQPAITEAAPATAEAAPAAATATAAPPAAPVEETSTEAAPAEPTPLSPYTNVSPHLIYTHCHSSLSPDKSFLDIVFITLHLQILCSIRISNHHPPLRHWHRLRRLKMSRNPRAQRPNLHLQLTQHQ